MQLHDQWSGKNIFIIKTIDLAVKLTVCLNNFTHLQ